MKKMFTVLLATAFAVSAQAQSGARIAGSLKDAEGKPLAAATVSLLRAKDSSLAKLALTDKTGQYEFAGIKEGQYLVSYTSVGYDRQFSKTFDATGSVDMPAMALVRSSKEMAGVTVAVRRPLVEARMDKMIVNVDASPTNAGSSALEVLEKAPGVTVDKDGNISLKGKTGVIVLVDGKQTYMSGQDLTNLLRNMPASQLDQIEIMTQPSAKFDASGNSGVLNLRTKKGLQKGFNGSVNLSYVQARYPKAPQSFNLNWRTSKVNVFSTLSYSYWEGFNKLNIFRRFPGRIFDQESEPHFKSNNFNGRVGVDYSIDKKTTVGVILNGGYSIRRNDLFSHTTISNDQGVIESFNQAVSDNKDIWKNFGANANFRRLLKKQGAEITADMDYIIYRTSSDQLINNISYTPLMAQDGNPYLLFGRLPGKTDIVSGKVDVVLPMKTAGKLEFGAKSSFVKNDNDAPYLSKDWTANKDTVDARSNHFIYEENINAGYVNWSDQMAKWSYQLGLRLEHTHSIGTSLTSKNRVARDYAQLFPTAFVSYKVNDKNTLGLSYSRRLVRPAYPDLNPFQRILDKYTYQQGNPYLTPMFSHNIELSHNFKGIVNTVFNYTKTTDIINDILKQSGTTTFQTKENIAASRNIGLAVSVNLQLKKWWFLNAYVNGYNNHFSGIVNNEPLDVSMTAWMANMSNQFRLNKGWTLEMNGFYRSTTQDAGIIVARPMGVVSFGVSKSILKNMGTIKLNLNDPFYIQKFRGYTKFHDIDMDIKSQWDNRRVGISFNWRFSKGQSAPQQRKRTSSAQDEQNRVGGGSPQ
jgi:hypothetical protein